MGRYSDNPLMDMAIDAALALVLLLYPLWRIFSRAGLKPTASLLVLVPYAGGLIVVLLLALKDWPNVRRSGSPEDPGGAGA